MRYVPGRHGLTLAIGDGEPEDPGHDGLEGGDGVLRVTDACVTLEMAAADGGRTVLAWDPAEVDWETVTG